jgi:Dolichyl-phosphate-mannose-protein mannosyltransferase
MKPGVVDQNEPVKHERTLLCAIVLTGLLLRLYGIGYALPYTYWADEGIFVRLAGDMLANRDPNPHWFGAPATTVVYVMCAVFVSIYLGGLGLGRFGSPQDLRAFFSHDPTIPYMSGRVAFALFGTLSIVLVWAAARRIFSSRAGLAAATLVAVNPLLVFHSKVIRPDILMTFFVLLVFMLSLRIAEQAKSSRYVLAGLWTGLAVATKFPAVTASVLVPAASAISGRPAVAEARRLSLYAAAVVVCTFLASPFLFLDLRTVLADVTHEARPTHLGATGEGFGSNLAWYIGQPLLDTFTWPGLALVLAGIILALWSPRRIAWLVVLWPALFLAFISGLSLRWERWVIPVIPFLAMLAAAGWSWSISAISRRSRVSVGRWCGFAVAMFVLLPLLRADIIQGREMSGIDTRILAGAWIIDHVPPGSKLLIEEWGPQLPKDRFRYYAAKGGGIEAVDTRESAVDVYRPKGQVAQLTKLDSILSEDIDFIVMTDWYEQFLADSRRFEDYADVVATYEKVMGMGEKVYEVQRTRGVNLGPPVRVYRVPKRR